MGEKILIPNSTQIPNVVLDLLNPRLPDTEARVMTYICRRTFGFHKESDRISLSQFIGGIKVDGKVKDYGSGSGRPAVVEALRNLTKAGAIFCTRDTKGNIYSINLNMDVDEVVRKTNQLRKQTRSGLKNKPKQVRLFNLQKKGKQRETKETPFLKPVNNGRPTMRGGGLKPLFDINNDSQRSEIDSRVRAESQR